MKKMLPWMKWMAKIALSAALVSLITIVTTWFIVGSALTQLLQQFQLPANLMPKVQISDVFAGWFGGPPKAGGDRAADSASLTQTPGPSATPAPQGRETSGAAGNAGAGSDTRADVRAWDAPQASLGAAAADTGEGGPAASPATGGDASPPGDAVAVSGDVALSEEQIAQTKRDMSAEDRMTLFTLVAAKLSDRDMQRISEWMENGLTNDERKDMQELLQKQLPAKEYEELLAILAKYAS